MEKTGKSGPLIETDLEFLGYHNVSMKDANSFGLHQQRCRVFKAYIQAGIAEHIHWFVYLLTGCRDEDIRNVEDAVLNVGSIFTREDCFIVIPESMKERNVLKRLKNEGRIYIFEDLMWKKIQQIFSGYIREDNERIESLQTKYYVEPQVVEDSNDTPWSLTKLSNIFSGKGSDESIVVIHADAGVGKTTLAAKMAFDLAKRWEKSRIVPLFLTGQANWRELSERARNATNLGDILILLLAADGAEFPLRRTELFTRIMQLGYFAFIFDGFDELTKPSGTVKLSPQENFDWLAGIAKDSNTRIMLTTRSSFWQREISELTAEKHKVFRLKPFDADSISKYFKQYFDGKENGDNLVQKAQKFYSDLRKPQSSNTNGDSFFNLPACVMMIADQVQRDSGGDYVAMTDTPTQQDPSRQLFLQIMHRENKRQQTQIGVETMHEVFENIAVTSSEFELDDIASDPKCEIQPEDIDKIANHAFLKDINDRPGRLCFKTDFLRHYLQASYILRFITEKQNQRFYDEYKRNRDLKAIVETEADGSGHLSERIAHVLCLSNADKYKPNMDNTANLHKICGDGKVDLPLKSFLFHIIAKTVISRNHDESRRERGDTLLSLLADGNVKRVSNLHVRGALSDIYMNDWEIRGSSFYDFSLVKGSNLQFVNCKFSRNLNLPKNTKFENCVGDGTAKLFLNKIGSMEITEEDVRKNLETVLSRFWIRGRLRRSAISEDEWKTGKTAAIEQSYSLLEILKQEDVVEKHKHYPRLQIKTNAINDVKECMENGIAQGRIQAVLKRMGENIHTRR